MLFLGGQLCIEKVDIQQDGGNQLSCNRLGILPSLNFTCNGTISGIMTGVMKIFDENKTDFPYFQVWRPSSNNSMAYTNIGKVQLQESQVSHCINNSYCYANIILTGNDRIEFQSGDVVGYYHPNSTRYRISTIPTDVYLQYCLTLSSSSLSVSLSNANASDDFQLPLIQFVIGKKYCTCVT